MTDLDPHLLSLHPADFGLLAEIFDAIPLPIVMKSLREESFGRFLFWNQAAEVTFGVSAQEAVGRTDGHFFPEDQTRFFLETDREVARTREARVITKETITSLSKGARRLHTTKVPICDADGSPVALLVVSEDITDRELNRIELQRALDFLNSINSQLPGVVYKFRLDAEGRSTFPYVSEGIRAITGDDAQEVMDGRANLLSRILPEDLPGFLSQVAKSRREMCHCRQEFRLRDNVGQVRWAMTSSLPKQDRDGATIWYGFLSDITEAKATTEALRRGEERLRAALEATRAAVWEIDVQEGAMFLSPEWGQLFGFAPEHFPRTFAEWLGTVHPEDVAVVQPLQEIVAGGEGGQFEFRHRQENGEYLWVLMRGKPVFNADGELIRQIGTFVDITDRHLTNRQLIEAKEAAERASEAKGEFLAMMSHEIRTPLNAVLGFSELLSAMPLEPEQADYLRTIQENSSALLVILNDVLDYSKIESGRLDLNPAPVDLARLVRSAAEFFRAQAVNKGIDLEVQCASDVPEKLLCDAARIHQILYNLISNAVKFTDRGTVRVELDVAGACVDGRWPVRMRVSDSGIGIALDRHPGLFDPFYQADSSTRRRHGGTGLGLAIVKRLASLMDGVIGIQSGEGEGTVFTVRLSLPEPAAEEPESALSDKSGTVNLSKLLPKILVIEDNATNRRLVRLFLRKFGLDADEAENGYDGVAMAGAKRYDVIFMDLDMPGMDGYEATRLIREADPSREPYIVALTAHALPEYRERSIRAGMNSYLSKPVKQMELKQVIRDAMRRLR